MKAKQSVDFKADKRMRASQSGHRLSLTLLNHIRVASYLSSFILHPSSFQERLALLVVLAIFFAFPLALFGYQTWRTNEPGVRVVTIEGWAPDKGGWKPDTIRVNKGERVRLRIASSDVVHTLEVPALGIASGDILPGHVEEIDFIAQQVGRFAFACTRWCSLDHWRMRGAIEVVDPNNPDAVPEQSPPPLYQQLGLDLDAMRHAHSVPPVKPSAERGAPLLSRLPSALRNYTELRTRSPIEVFLQLRANNSFDDLSDTQVWDLIAALWEQTGGTESRQRGQRLYARDCAACHGETGKGDGIAARDLPGMAAMDPTMPRGAADFTDLSQMVTASDVLLQGKILRGGMGTGMPEFGSLYTERDLWDVVAFIRSFAFEY